ncbi:MAG: ANTAR domain-containing protein [gamma proteobacterium symbiont of Bathyaustriella thionipta]|nr:ANTAR domain-containing protein [gamma proteobacterium symbiont of Bathyaustriella thionipta]MCU7950775.1 ANTAR domain-containing protein [gamma proteobacterium symbiont of Bathyaustriella thionipta]MCU7954178.1 ANTAR domain-containing protein [gamma proteobacterium symbiont of Bathyaustriella thionipta]MCU7957291.1 ANTAR domain-containing protein [gamma proteobacterium symbiont of Bathyaustriella thionipta]MCU7965892.1 ANTAR domain-containing protein [gamma proteobacterium symbiont of Bathy
MTTLQILLIVDSNNDSCIELQGALASNGFNVIKTINVKKDQDFTDQYGQVSALVCQFHTVKETYLNTISKFVQSKPMPVILFTNDDSRSAIDKSVKIGVNAYIIDGFNSERIKTIIDVAISRFKSYQEISDELHKTRLQLEDRKLIDKAKGILMKSKNIDEQQAYKMIRKMAMDKSKSMGDIARSIIDLMELMI